MSDREQLHQDAHSCLNGFFERVPVAATFLGDHRYDDKLGSYAKESYQERILWAKDWIRKFEAYKVDGWSVEEQIDREILMRVARRMLRNVERIRLDQRSPFSALEWSVNGLFLIIQRTYAPLEERMEKIARRMEEFPRYLKEATETIEVAETPRFWAEQGHEFGKGAAFLLQKQWIPFCQALPKSLRKDVTLAAEKAAVALNEYSEWVGSKVLPHADASFALGKELFDEILTDEHMVDYDSDELHELIWDAYRGLEAQLLEAAKEIDSTLSVHEVMEQIGRDTPPADKLIELYQEKIAAARQFVIDNDIATLPPGESFRVEATHPLLRPVVPYGAILVPYFVGPLQETAFIVTPAPEDQSPEELAEFLGRHAYTHLTMSSIHEVYPGHRLQLAVGAAKGSLPRQLGRFLSPSPFGGWAYYAEEVMEDTGFLETPEERLVRLHLQLERCSLGVIDVSLHTGRMNLEEAATFLADRTGLAADNINFQLNFSLKEPGERQAYYTGYMQVRKLVDDYKERFPEARLGEVNDAILNCGQIPPKLMRKQLL